MFRKNPYEHIKVEGYEYKISALKEAIKHQNDRIKKELHQSESELERPSGKYRIVKIERADPSLGQDGYFVQTWHVRRSGDVDRFTELNLPNFHTIGTEVWFQREISRLETVLRVKEKVEGAAHIEWFNIGSANPHETYEEAERWLLKWLRPELQEVLFDADGVKVSGG